MKPRRMPLFFILAAVLAALMITSATAGATPAPGPDSFGYQSSPVPGTFYPVSGFNYAFGGALEPIDGVSPAIPIGFPFVFYGITYEDVYVSTNGFITFDANSPAGAPEGLPMPQIGGPDASIAGLWTGLDSNSFGTIWVETIGTAPNRTFVVWFAENWYFLYGDAASFQIVLHEGSNDIELLYGAVAADPSGRQQSIGIENQHGTDGLQIAYGPNVAEALAGTGFLLSAPPGIDSDGDGVIDSIDDYPLDPTRAIECAPGFFGTFACDPAPPGSYVDQAGQIEATLCAVGTFSATSGSVACAEAPAGKFVAGVGATAATPCAVGTFQPDAGQSSCVFAPIGTYVDLVGATSATACPAGTTTQAAGSDSATDCESAPEVDDFDGDGIPDSIDTETDMQAVTLDVIAEIEGLALVAGADAKRLGKALDDLEKGLEDDLWASPGVLDARKGHKVFDRHAAAIKDLQKLIDDGSSLSNELAALIETIVEGDRRLAIEAIATATGGDAKDLAKAAKDLAKGDARRSSGDADKAVKHYKSAWKHAIKALR